MDPKTLRFNWWVTRNEISCYVFNFSHKPKMALRALHHPFKHLSLLVWSSPVALFRTLIDFTKLIPSSISCRWGDEAVRGLQAILLSLKLKELQQSKILSNLDKSSAVPTAFDGNPPNATYVAMPAATERLNTCIASLTFILANCGGLICFSVNFGAVLMARFYSLSKNALISDHKAVLLSKLKLYFNRLFLTDFNKCGGSKIVKYCSPCIS